jgi:diaminohydroxyphosphoribosylaminopyrimidine deaminase/5-amino-6-(5-phosphoribosylamino)uracil reductase
VWVTGPLARAQGHLLRAQTDAILVGRQTVVDDDPELTCRLPGLLHRSPIRIVLATRLEGMAGTRLAATARQVPVWLFCVPGSDEDQIATLKASGVRIFQAPAVAGRLWLPAVMEALVAEGVTRLLVEGGPGMWRAFSKVGLLDEVVMFRARGESNGHVGPDQALRDLASFIDRQGLSLAEQRHLGTDEAFVFRRLPVAGARPQT